CGKPLNKWDKLCDDCHNRNSEIMQRLHANPTEAMIKVREEYVKKHRQFMEMCFSSKNRKAKK
ncbi:MAG: hypothetical protein NC489_07920, partial [Ruminococcus flavefaciens]|nr:hypothetical protein [Ruminococcus flavefaciens]